MIYPKQPKFHISTPMTISRGNNQQLSQFLINKIMQKHSAELDMAGIDYSMISDKVNKFLAQGHITESKLYKLDQEISDAVKSRLKIKRLQPTKGNYSKMRVQSVPEITQIIEPENRWSTLIKYNDYMVEKERLETALNKTKMKRKLKGELDKQISENRRNRIENGRIEHKLENMQVKMEIEKERKDKIKENNKKIKDCKTEREFIKMHQGINIYYDR